MPHSQREIVFLTFDLPQGYIEHPAIILSCSSAMEAEEGRFIAVMMTSEPQDDDFTFEITKDMINPPMPTEYQEARLHIVSYFTEDQVRRTTPIRHLRKEYFDQLIRRINNVAFNI